MNGLVVQDEILFGRYGDKALLPRKKNSFLSFNLVKDTDPSHVLTY